MRLGQGRAQRSIVLCAALAVCAVLAVAACDQTPKGDQIATEPTPVVSTLTSVGVTQPDDETARPSTKAAPTGTVIPMSSIPTPSSGTAMAATPTPTKTQSPTSAPTATPISRAALDAMAPSGFVIPEAPESYCMATVEEWADRKLLRWTGDGAKILFDHGDESSHFRTAREGQAVYVVDADGSRIQRMAEGSFIHVDRSSRPLPIGRMTHFDVSPDGSRIVYSTCRHGPLSADPPKKGTNLEYRHSYEIDSVNIDGTDLRRLTSDSRMDNYPVWSPDGTRIAFIRDMRMMLDSRVAFGYLGWDFPIKP